MPPGKKKSLFIFKSKYGNQITLNRFTSTEYIILEWHERDGEVSQTMLVFY